MHMKYRRVRREVESAGKIWSRRRMALEAVAAGRRPIRPSTAARRFPLSTPSAGSKRVFRILRRKKNSPRRPGERTPPARPINRLSMRENRYLIRQLCWVFNIQGLETYLLVPRDPADIELLVEAIRPAPSPYDIDVVIGTRGPIAPPEMCNGLMVPIVVFDQMYSFDRDTLIKAIPKPDNLSDEQFGPAAEELFNRIMQLTDNAGATDEHRALNYLAMRYPA